MKLSNRVPFFISSFIACSIMALTSGCASGGYKITRSYSKWVNSQFIVLRIIIYFFTGIVFAITMIIDLVVFNTIDFWEGKVSTGDFLFKEGDKTFHVKHGFQEGSELKRSRIEVRGPDEKILQIVQIDETPTGEIELHVDGKLRSRVHGIKSIPVAKIFDDKGQLASEHFVPQIDGELSRRSVARK